MIDYNKEWAIDTSSIFTAMYMMIPENTNQTVSIRELLNMFTLENAILVYIKHLEYEGNSTGMNSLLNLELLNDPTEGLKQIKDYCTESLASGEAYNTISSLIDILWVSELGENPSGSMSLSKENMNLFLGMNDKDSTSKEAVIKVLNALLYDRVIKIIQYVGRTEYRVIYDLNFVELMLIRMRGMLVHISNTNEDIDFMPDLLGTPTANQIKLFKDVVFGFKTYIYNKKVSAVQIEITSYTGNFTNILPLKDISIPFYFTSLPNEAPLKRTCHFTNTEYKGKKDLIFTANVPQFKYIYIGDSESREKYPTLNYVEKGTVRFENLSNPSDYIYWYYDKYYHRLDFENNIVNTGFYKLKLILTQPPTAMLPLNFYPQPTENNITRGVNVSINKAMSETFTCVLRLRNNVTGEITNGNKITFNKNNKQTSSGVGVHQTVVGITSVTPMEVSDSTGKMYAPVFGDWIESTNKREYNLILKLNGPLPPGGKANGTLVIDFYASTSATGAEVGQKSITYKFTTANQILELGTITETEAGSIRAKLIPVDDGYTYYIVDPIKIITTNINYEFTVNYQ